VDEGTRIVRAVPLRYLVRSVVEPALETLPTIQLEDVEPGAARLVAPLTRRDPAGSNLFSPGDVLFSKLRPYLAKSFLVSDRIQGSGEFLCLRPGSKTDSRFLMYATLSRPWLDHASLTSYGTKMPRTSWEQMADLRLTMPSVEDQRRIADFLDDRVARIDQIIAARRAQIAMVQGLYTAWLAGWTASMGLRNGWSPLRRFGVHIEQGWSPEADSVPAAAGEAGVLKLGSVRGGAFRPEENKAFLEGSVPRSEYRVREGDLLVTRANTPSLVGDAAVVCGVELQDLYLSDLIYRLTMDQYDPHFASAALRSPHVRQRIGVIARGTSGSMPKLRGADILDLQVPAVRLAEQHGLAREDIEARSVRDARTTTLSASIERLAEYKQSLITAAVTGELDVTTAGSGVPG
jgi:type I restriction enzyme S subunit